MQGIAEQNGPISHKPRRVDVAVLDILAGKRADEAGSASNLLSGEAGMKPVRAMRSLLPAAELERSIGDNP